MHKLIYLQDIEIEERNVEIAQNDIVLINQDVVIIGLKINVAGEAIGFIKENLNNGEGLIGAIESFKIQIEKDKKCLESKNEELQASKKILAYYQDKLESAKERYGQFLSGQVVEDAVFVELLEKRTSELKTLKEEIDEKKRKRKDSVSHSDELEELKQKLYELKTMAG